MEAGLLELRLDDIANQRQYLRLGFEQLVCGLACCTSFTVSRFTSS